jgi:hypothetical protein
MHVKFLSLGIAVMMLSVCRYRSQPVGHHIMTPLWHGYMRYESCLYLAMVMNVKFLCLGVAVMMLSVCRDRNQPVDQHIMTPLWYR